MVENMLFAGLVTLRYVDGAAGVDGANQSVEILRVLTRGVTMCSRSVKDRMHQRGEHQPLMHERPEKEIVFEMLSIHFAQDIGWNS